MVKSASFYLISEKNYRSGKTTIFHQLLQKTMIFSQKVKKSFFSKRALQIFFQSFLLCLVKLVLTFSAKKVSIRIINLAVHLTTCDVYMCGSAEVCNVYVCGSVRVCICVGLCVYVWLCVCVCVTVCLYERVRE